MRSRERPLRKPWRHQEQGQAHHPACDPGQRRRERDHPSCLFTITLFEFRHIFGSRRPGAEPGQESEHGHGALDSPQFTEPLLAQHAGHENGSEQIEAARGRSPHKTPECAARESIT